MWHSLVPYTCRSPDLVPSVWRKSPYTRRVLVCSYVCSWRVCVSSGQNPPVLMSARVRFASIGGPYWSVLVITSR